MIRFARLVLCLGFLCVALVPVAKGQSVSPAVHLVAPSDKQLMRHDSLLSETVLRLMTIDLAARHGVWARYWPYDHVSKMSDKDYPRCLVRVVAVKDKNQPVGTHIVIAELTTKPGKASVITEQKVSWESYSTLVASIRSFAEKTKAELVKELDLPKEIKRRPARLRRRDIVLLAESRTRACSMISGKILDASKLVDQVLNRSPNAWQAHAQAAHCGAMLALQEVYGFFDDRGRYLAGPLSHWLLAESLSPGKSSRDALTGAWMRFVCGYPDEALQLLEQAKLKPGTESRALRMYITRDYTPFTPEQILNAKPLLQLAWLWATQECTRHDLLLSVPAKMTKLWQSPAFLPMYESTGIGPENTYTYMGMHYAYARDAFDLLTRAELGEKPCRELAESMAGNVGVSMEKDYRQLVGTIAQTVVQKGFGNKMVDSYSDLMKLYALAMQEGQPVSCERGKMKWSSLTRHDYANLQCGIFLRTLHRWAIHMGGDLGAFSLTGKICRKTAKGLSANPLMSDFFEAYSHGITCCRNKANDIADRIILSERGSQANMLFMILYEWGCCHPWYERKEEIRYGVARGAWQWGLLSKHNLHKKDSDCLKNAKLTLGVDTFTSRAEASYLCHSDDLASFLKRAESKPYNLDVWEDLGWYGEQEEKWDLAQKGYTHMIKIAPKAFKGYTRLVELKIKRKDRQGTIETAKLAAERCEFTVGLSNMMGNLAIWLVEEGKAKEALDYGKRAAASYSYKGLEGLAVALEANKQIDDARVIWRKMALRYLQGTMDYMKFLAKHDISTREMSQALAEVLKEHSGRKSTIISWMKMGVRKSPRCDAIIAAMLKGPLSYLSEDRKAKLLFDFHIPYTGEEWDAIQGKVYKLYAVAHGEKTPMATGVSVRKGQRILVACNPDDKWSGVQTKGKETDYRGHNDRNHWMRLYAKVGKGNWAADLGSFVASENNELFLYCHDDACQDNEGFVRVKILVDEAKKVSEESASAGEKESPES